MKRLPRSFMSLVFFIVVLGICALLKAQSAVAENAVSASTRAALKEAGAQLGNPILIRVFKRDQEEFDENPSVAISCGNHHPSYPPRARTMYRGGGYDEWLRSPHIGKNNLFSADVGRMEVWIRSSSGRYVLVQSFKIGVYSGPLGPKTAQNDGQTPEGFYSITPYAMKGAGETSYNRAMVLNYPNNPYDQAHHHTGGSIEIHGDDRSIGCMAIQNHIYDVYSLVDAALKAGEKSVPVEIFPFPLKSENLAKINDPANPGCAAKLKDFWKMLQPAYLDFDQTHLPPTISYGSNGDYIVSEPLPDMGVLNRVGNVGAPPSCPTCVSR